MKTGLASAHIGRVTDITLANSVEIFTTWHLLLIIASWSTACYRSICRVCVCLSPADGRTGKPVEISAHWPLFRGFTRVILASHYDSSVQHVNLTLATIRRSLSAGRGLLRRSCRVRYYDTMSQRTPLFFELAATSSANVVRGSLREKYYKSSSATSVANSDMKHVKNIYKKTRGYTFTPSKKLRPECNGNTSPNVDLLLEFRP